MSDREARLIQFAKRLVMRLCEQDFQRGVVTSPQITADVFEETLQQWMEINGLVLTPADGTVDPDDQIPY